MRASDRRYQQEATARQAGLKQVTELKHSLEDLVEGAQTKELKLFYRQLANRLLRPDM